MESSSLPAVLFALAVVAPVCGDVETPAPVASITEATWAEYAQWYPRSPLCEDGEITLWTCAASRGRVYSLCATERVTRDAGYFQYRASRKGKLVFAYPETKAPPLGRFTYSSYANGDAALDFVHAGHRYTLVDPLRGGAAIEVETPGGESSEIACPDGGGTLQLNYTMRLMYDSGVWSR